jgi:hypothetical protein
MTGPLTPLVDPQLPATPHFNAESHESPLRLDGAGRSILRDQVWVASLVKVGTTKRRSVAVTRSMDAPGGHVPMPIATAGWLALGGQLRAPVGACRRALTRPLHR